MIPIQYFKEKAAEIANEIINLRKWLHQHPELSFQEKNTSSFIAQILTTWNIPFKKDIGGNGIVAWVKGKDEGKSIAIRADIDALPIQEETGLDFTSKVNGVMHACGHDVHTALLLGAIFILNQIKNDFDGCIYAIFQPAEEKIPGGAIAMLNDPFFQSLQFDAVIAQHVSPEIPCGYIGLKAGPYMASTDEVYITISGKGGHAAMPHQINDTVLAASHLIVMMQSIVSRFSNPNVPTVLSFGKFIANGSTNIIPDKVFLEGTFRTFDEEWRKNALQKLKNICSQLATSMSVEVEVNILNGYPVLKNDVNLTKLVYEISKEFLTSERIITLEARTTAEDFAYFSLKYPSLMFRLGTGGEQYCSYPLHSSKFNVNDRVFTFAHGLLANMAYRLIKT
ncbi:MAG: M20 family metallopeptidase [Bacteroidales bacterium]|nr:M20 family metallopeptidase [Bacteroidales bacterium]